MINESASLDLAHVRRTLHARGQRLTRLKREVLQTLACSEGALTVEELSRHLAGGEDPSPLYRCLTGLEEARLVTQIGLGDGVRRYALAEGLGHHHDYLVCTRCAAVEEVDGCLLAAGAAQTADSHGFRVEDHQVVLRGLCRQCREGGVK